MVASFKCVITNTQPNAVEALSDSSEHPAVGAVETPGERSVAPHRPSHFEDQHDSQGYTRLLRTDLHGVPIDDRERFPRERARERREPLELTRHGRQQLIPSLTAASGVAAVHLAVEIASIRG